MYKIKIIQPRIGFAALSRLPKCDCIQLRYYCSSEKDEEDKKPSEKKTPELPEAPTTCCMSGCANCVWLEYAEKLTQYFRDGGEQALKEINEKVDDPNIKAFILQELRTRKNT